MGICAGGLLLAFAATVAEADGTIDPRGMPEGTVASAPMRYSLWCDSAGAQSQWHLRTTTSKGQSQHFKGHISLMTNGALDKTAGVALEKAGPAADHFSVSTDKKTINFDFSTIGVEDGLDWVVKGNPQMISFTLELGEKSPTFDASKIFIGKKGAHPSANPFELKAHGQ
jgi:hypothetical protein